MQLLWVGQESHPHTKRRIPDVDIHIQVWNGVYGLSSPSTRRNLLEGQGQNLAFTEGGGSQQVESGGFEGAPVPRAQHHCLSSPHFEMPNRGRALAAAEEKTVKLLCNCTKLTEFHASQ
ncbi:Hypothetical predicted protein [Podarcis lilfordi]|uniref:Uncharacterized protein n=1 Tax=Podarcis lilfordi TaxID=74358 RepID=A0AA35KQ50_9SAUR|nr:Hypothetical predicted protein [Podarcis lilfordi]